MLIRVQLFVTPTDYTVHRILQARILDQVIFPFSKGSSQPRDQTQVSHIAGSLFTSWATREHKNTGVGSLSLLQGIFPAQELNQGFLHCKQILYQLSSKGTLLKYIGSIYWQKHFLNNQEVYLSNSDTEEKKLTSFGKHIAGS